MKRGGMVWAFEAAVRTILKWTVSTEAVEMRETMQSLVTNMHGSGLTYSECVREFKKAFIGHVLEEKHGNQSRAARDLGMHRNTLSRTISELNMNVEDYAPRRKPIGAERMTQVHEAQRA